MPEDLVEDQVEAAMRSVPEEVLQNSFLWGTADDVVDSIKRLGEAGLRHISLIPMSYAVTKTLANYTWRALPSIIRRLRNY